MGGQPTTQFAKNRVKDSRHYSFWTAVYGLADWRKRLCTSIVTYCIFPALFIVTFPFEALGSIRLLPSGTFRFHSSSSSYRSLRFYSPFHHSSFRATNEFHRVNGSSVRLFLFGYLVIKTRQIRTFRGPWPYPSPIGFRAVTITFSYLQPRFTYTEGFPVRGCLVFFWIEYISDII
ncbi:hypothetical protein CRG98_046466 [Punica granatum]|uniref:Uncharacterized protein n=1 Tax=Punica granatum TaxID=22663 RepID=A0A2I0HN28_PUNGR|nr:hypothetical protein CRG98_046466 [Punica granatum]